MVKKFLRTLTLFAPVAFVCALFLGCSSSSGINHADMNHGDMTGGQALHKRASKIEWLSFEEGKKRALATGKLMVVDFYVSQGCHRCDMMAWKLWPDPAVVELIDEHFIPVRVDLEGNMPAEARALGKKYDFQFECLLLICDAEGKAVKENTTGSMCFADMVTAEWFVAYLKQASGITDDEDFFSDME